MGIEADRHEPVRADRASRARCSLGDPLFAERYRAIDARDTRFDGQFFTAVSSTGIYCRPSCPARTPKPENVTFYLTSAAAHEGGYRACKRCLPEAAPGTPEWDLRRDVAGRAMRLIGDGVVDRDGIHGLAAGLGYTPRHVHRMLVAELGAGPLALARARRAQAARALLVSSDLPLSQVAFAAGFGSIRQFNETIQQVFAATPGELRARGRRGSHHDGAEPGRRGLAPGAATSGLAAGAPGADAPGADPSGEVAPVRLGVDLPVRQPFDAPGVFAFLAARAVDGVEVADVSRGDRLRYARTLSLPHGPGAVDVVATAGPRGEWQVRAQLELVSLGDVAPAVARVRRMLDLDADPVAVDGALGADPVLAPLVARTPGIRVPGAVDPHELVVRALVGQQISVAAARTHLSRLAAHAGSTYSSTLAGLDRLFPTPDQILRTVPEPAPDEALDAARPLRLPGRAVRTVLATCRALADGGLAVHVGVEPEVLRAQLVARPGIGPWTAAYVAMRVLGDPDTWLTGDVAVLAGARSAGAITDDQPSAAAHRVLTERAAAWAPWRSYATMHLWQAATRQTTVR